MKVHVLPYGMLSAPEAIMYGEGYSMEDMSLFPSYGVLVEHNDGLVLFDTGCPMAPDFPDLVPAMLVYDESDAVTNRLGTLGYAPSDIDYVVFSHMHIDHVGNIQLFSEATLVAGEDELEGFANNDDPLMPSALVEFAKNPALSWRLLGLGAHELLPGITLHNFGPGHSFNMVAMQLDLASGTVLVASDICYHDAAFAGQMPGMVFDADGYTQSLTALKELGAQLDAEIWFGHDPVQFETLKKLPEFYA